MANLINNVRGVGKNSVIRKAQDSQALRNHKSVALLIVMPSLVWFVGGTVAFDHKIGFVTIKVRDVIAKLMLPPEFESKKPSIPQHSPQELFCGRLVLPELASESFLSGELKPGAIVSAFSHQELIIALNASKRFCIELRLAPFSLWEKGRG